MSPKRNRPLLLRLGVWGYLGLALLLGLWAEVWQHSGMVNPTEPADDVALVARHFTHGEKPVAMRYAQLSAQMDEAALKAHFDGLPLGCAPAQHQPSQTECLATPDQVDGVSALQLRLLLADGHLSEATVLLPWWRHHTALRALLRDLGAAHALSPENEPQPQIIWRVPGGEVRLNRAPGFDPLHASRIVWRAAEIAPAALVNPATKSP
ncbi:hypothetical protein [Variovorax sp. HJSM1_2]|uniref:hypothetical protein n=1 Tax=Variovorax sp. HJSM1_2 TaxID=3366263 RepID=UPI003BDF3A62